MKGMEGVFANLKNITAEMLKKSAEVAQETAAEMERYAKETARWHDRTGDARKGLTGSADISSKAISASIHQDLYGQTGKKYGWNLEHEYGGKYAILEETRNTHADMFFDGIAKACEDTINKI
ncbi:MAG: hypothetical protein P1P63_08280 [Treponemataceae bacterium]